ncbi:serine/threonine protein kinase [Dictyobacter kobayashii]|uniref:non-specific serine/threonine protein kinase n=1 Tax=Dictyobacter kobayashii TaxID=2014872 RepID=A0A402AEW1_9CHLR|nr:serine/threonine-protein kinase [Dictyobacter kobayashii]GCE17657.1 hypothetical protein KDK_14570 [Dictyobacter kobayashii]
MKVNDDLIGTVLGSYTLEKIVGYSRLSAVYLARQSHPGRLVAVKIVQAQSPGRDDFFLRFRREVTSIARLEHPHILPLLDYEERDQLAYVVMPYIGAGNLEQVLKREGKLAPRQVLSYLLQIASALDYAHALHVVHGDLKPTNILLYPDGRLVLTDFALANLTECAADIDYTAELLTTSLYMSPEMVRGEPLTHCSDIYQLGTLLFQMLCGHVPFKGEGTYTLMRQHLQERLPSVAVLTPDLPQTLDRVLQKATAKNPAERYRSVGELAQAFAAAIAPLDKPQQSLPHHLQSQERPQSLSDLSKLEFITTSICPPSSALPESPPTPVKVVVDSGPLTADFGFSYIQDQILPLPSTISRKPHIFSFFLLRCLPLFVLIGIGTLAFLNVLGAFATSPSTSAEQARTVISQYYDDLNQHNYRLAYALCSTNFRRRISYARFVSSYQHLTHSDILFKQTAERSPSEVNVVMQLQTQEKASQGTLIQHYQWNGMVDRQSDGSWQIEQITISPDRALDSV